MSEASCCCGTGAGIYTSRPEAPGNSAVADCSSSAVSRLSGEPPAHDDEEVWHSSLHESSHGVTKNGEILPWEHRAHEKHVGAGWATSSSSND